MSQQVLELERQKQEGQPITQRNLKKTQFRIKILLLTLRKIVIGQAERPRGHQHQKLKQ